MLKFGFIGLGQAGGKIADAFQSISREHYVAIAINTAQSDMQLLQHIEESHRYGLKGSEFGAARTPEIAYQAIFDENNGAEVFEKINRVFSDVDYVWLVAGLGGGTGTGLMQAFVDHALESFSFPIGAIVTIPAENDGIIQKYNALETLNKLQNAMDSCKLASMIVIDNERFLSQLAEEKRSGDWKEFSNAKVVELLHSINSITQDSGSINFDRADFLKLLNANGCISIGKAKIRKYDQESVLSTIQNTIQRGFLSNGYRFEESSYFSVNYQLNSNARAITSASYEKYILENIGKQFPNALDHFVSYYETEDEDSSVLTILAGLGLPDRVFKMKQQLEGVNLNQDKKKISLVAQKPSFLTNKSFDLSNKKSSAVNPFLKKETPLEDRPTNPFIK